MCFNIKYEYVGGKTKLGFHLFAKGLLLVDFCNLIVSQFNRIFFNGRLHIVGMHNRGWLSRFVF